MNPALLIFTQIAIAGCGFLVYFLYAVRRESRQVRKGPKIEIRPVSTQANATKVIQLYSVDEPAARKRRGASGR